MTSEKNTSSSDYESAEGDPNSLSEKEQEPKILPKKSKSKSGPRKLAKKMDMTDIVNDTLREEFEDFDLEVSLLESQRFIKLRQLERLKKDLNMSKVQYEYYKSRINNEKKEGGETFDEVTPEIQRQFKKSLSRIILKGTGNIGVIILKSFWFVTYNGALRPIKYVYDKTLGQAVNIVFIITGFVMLGGILFCRVYITDAVYLTKDGNWTEYPHGQLAQLAGTFVPEAVSNPSQYFKNKAGEYFTAKVDSAEKMVNYTTTNFIIPLSRKFGRLIGEQIIDTTKTGIKKLPGDTWNDFTGWLESWTTGERDQLQLPGDTGNVFETGPEHMVRGDQDLGGGIGELKLSSKTFDLFAETLFNSIYSKYRNKKYRDELIKVLSEVQKGLKVNKSKVLIEKLRIKYEGLPLVIKGTLTKKKGKKRKKKKTIKGYFK